MSTRWIACQPGEGSMKTTNLAKFRCAAASAAIAALALPGIATAQDEAGPNETGAAVETVSDTVASEQEAIVVTGSRIARTGFSAPTPVTMVGQEDLQRQGSTNVADLLNTLPSFRPQSTPATVGIFNANAGANTADLRGLG